MKIIKNLKLIRKEQFFYDFLSLGNRNIRHLKDDFELICKTFHR